MKQHGYRTGCLCVLSLLLLTACSKPLPDERQISLTMEKMQQAADDKRLADLMQYFDAGFKGRQNMPKRDLQARIYFHFRINPRVRVYLSNTAIQVNNNTAKVSCHLLVTGAQQTMPQRGRLYRISSSWQKDGAEWRVTAADWEDVVEELVR